MANTSSSYVSALVQDVSGIIRNAIGMPVSTNVEKARFILKLREAARLIHEIIDGNHPEKLKMCEFSDLVNSFPNNVDTERGTASIPAELSSYKDATSIMVKIFIKENERGGSEADLEKIESFFKLFLC